VLLGFFLLLGGLALRAARHDARTLQLVVYFLPSATSTQVQDGERSLGAMADVRSVRYLTQAQVLAETVAQKKRTGIDDLLVESVPDSPSAYRVVPRPGADRQVIGRRLLGRPGTLSVVYPGE